jgi:probable F420-dependent oxidoreductase
MAVQIGIGLFTAQVPPGSKRTFTQEYRETVDLVRLAETVGFDSAWVSEHHGAGDGYLSGLLPTLAALAAVTDRIRLGTGVMLAPFYDPLRLAEDAATVDLISGGRLILGLGLGWREEEFRMFGVPIGERLRRTVETVEILRRAWTGERFSFEGKAYSYDQVQVTPPPVREGGIPIYLGGMSERAIRRAGRLGDGYIRTRGGWVDQMRHDAHLADEAARAAGKGPEFGFAQLQNAFVWDRGDAWEVVREGARWHIGVYGGWAAGSDTPGKDYFSLAPDDDTLKMITPSGTTDEITARLRQIVDPFADRQEFHLVVRLHYPDMPFEVAAHAIELFGAKVIPALKGN